MATNLNNFDINAWSQSSESVQNQPMAVTASSCHQDTPESIREQIYTVANQLIRQGIDITQGYVAWRNLGFALAHELGETGRQLYHDLSRMNSKYNARECDHQYSACLRGGEGGISILSFFYMAKEAGIDLRGIAHEAWIKAQEEVVRSASIEAESATSARSANMPNSTKMPKIAQNANLAEEMYNGSLADVAVPATFSNHLNREDLPSFLWPVWDSHSDDAGRDKMLLGVLNLISGVLPSSFYSIYDKRKVFTPLYNIIWGGFATLKGELEVCRQIIVPIKHEMRCQYEMQMKQFESEHSAWESAPKSERGIEPKEPVLKSPYVTANSSASAVYRSLDANEGWGVMFETEADTLTNMLSKAEYGDYSDLLRKAHHHECIAMTRVNERINIEIEHPRLSVFLTCTGSQLPLLLPASNIANGLASRFLFYALPDSKVEFRNVFEANDIPIEDVYHKLGEELMPLYHALQMRNDHPIQFVMSKAQQQEFVTTFDDVLKEQFSMMGDGIQGFIYRLALESYRYAMILTLLRRLSEWNKQESIFDDDERALPCDDRDFRSAIEIVNCLVCHTARVYSVLAQENNDPFNKAGVKLLPEVQNLYDAVKDKGTFTTADVLKAAQAAKIPERTAMRILGDLVAKYQKLKHPRKGIYEVVQCDPEL